MRGYINEKLKLTHKKNQESKNNLDYTRTLLLEARKIKQLEDDETNGEYDDNSDDENTEDNDTIQDSSKSFKIRPKKSSQASFRSGRSLSIQSMAPSGMSVCRTRWIFLKVLDFLQQDTCPI